MVKFKNLGKKRTLTFNHGNNDIELIEVAAGEIVDIPAKDAKGKRKVAHLRRMKALFEET